MGRALTVAAVAAAAAALVALSAGPALAKPGDAARFEVLQAVYHPLTSVDWSRQGLGARCVLAEQHAEGNDTDDNESRAAAGALLANTTRGQLLYAEFDGSMARFADYYRLQTEPIALFDGIGRVAGGGAQTLPHMQAAYDEAARLAPRASLNVTSDTVILSGHLLYEVSVPEALPQVKVSVRALLVEDNATSAEGVRDVRGLVRVVLAGDNLDVDQPASGSGRMNFTLEPGWVASRMAALVFVQVDTPAPSPPQSGAPGDNLTALIAAGVVLATAALMALLVVRLTRAERRARRR